MSDRLGLWHHTGVAEEPSDPAFAVRTTDTDLMT